MRSIFKVFYCDISQISFGEYNIFRKMSSRECRNAAEHFHFYEDAVRCIMAEVLLKYELYECNLYPETFEWKYSEYGKPYIESFNNFFLIFHILVNGLL